MPFSNSKNNFNGKLVSSTGIKDTNKKGIRRLNGTALILPQLSENLHNSVEDSWQIDKQEEHFHDKVLKKILFFLKITVKL